MLERKDRSGKKSGATGSWERFSSVKGTEDIFGMRKEKVGIKEKTKMGN